MLRDIVKICQHTKLIRIGSLVCSVKSRQQTTFWGLENLKTNFLPKTQNITRTKTVAYDLN